MPFGLLPIGLLGRLTATDTTLHRAGLSLFSALYGRDLALDNDLSPALGIERLSKDALMTAPKDGRA